MDIDIDSAVKRLVESVRGRQDDCIGDQLMHMENGGDAAVIVVETYEQLQAEDRQWFRAWLRSEL